VSFVGTEVSSSVRENSETLILDSSPFLAARSRLKHAELRGRMKKLHPVPTMATIVPCEKKKGDILLYQERRMSPVGLSFWTSVLIVMYGQESPIDRLGEVRANCE